MIATVPVAPYMFVVMKLPTSIQTVMTSSWMHSQKVWLTGPLSRFTHQNGATAIAAGCAVAFAAVGAVMTRTCRPCVSSVAYIAAKPLGCAISGRRWTVLSTRVANLRRNQPSDFCHKLQHITLFMPSFLYKPHLK